MRKKRFSPITSRILAVNVTALFLLVIGLLYSGKYERELTQTMLSSLTRQGQLLAAALAEGGVRADSEGSPMLAEDLALQMLRKLSEVSPQRTILFSKTGTQLVDSHQLTGPGGEVQIVDLPPPVSSLQFGERVRYYIYRVLDVLPTRMNLPKFPDDVSRGVQGYPDLIETLGGQSFMRVWRDHDGRIVLTAALPVQNLKNVLGAVFIMQPGQEIEKAVRDIQLTVLQLFFWVLAVTVILTLYLSETIARPISRLAEAADNVRQSLVFKDTIPDYSWRGDEVGRLSAAFIEMTRALAERVDAISNFAADVAHELKNPLASVRSAVDTLAVVKNQAQQEKLYAILRDDIDRMARLISDISSMSRMDADIMNAGKENLDLAVLVQSAVSSSAAGRAGRVANEAAPALELPVRGNGIQILQVLHNLLDNAYSFIPAGGRIRVRSRRLGDRAIVEVDNEGPFIPEGKLETIFTRFYTERPEDEKFGLHSGLGLSISRQIVQAHRGTLTAENLREGSGGINGVRFVMILPLGKT